MASRLGLLNRDSSERGFESHRLHFANFPSRGYVLVFLALSKDQAVNWI